jgi:tetratricopeptide (TPR) repeat protein
MKLLLIVCSVTLFLSCNNKSYFNEGLENYKSGNYEKAVEFFSKEIEVNPKNENAYYERGNSKFALNDFYGALKDIDEAIKINEHPAFFNNRSVINSKLGDYQNAIQDAAKAIELKDDYLEAYINRASAFTMLNENTKAIDDYTLVLILDPNNKVALVNRGVTYQKLNDLNKACLDWGIAAELGETNSLSFKKIYCE